MLVFSARCNTRVLALKALVIMKLEVILLSVIFLEIFSNAKAYKKFDMENYALVGHKLKSMTNIKFDKCVEACEMERACISVVFGGSPKGIGCCTLNDYGVEDEEHKNKSLVFTPGCWYRQIRPTVDYEQSLFFLLSLSSRRTLARGNIGAEK